jgi:hypothetical protein
MVGYQMTIVPVMHISKAHISVIGTKFAFLSGEIILTIPTEKSWMIYEIISRKRTGFST